MENTGLMYPLTRHLLYHNGNSLSIGDKISIAKYTGFEFVIVQIRMMVTKCNLIEVQDSSGYYCNFNLDEDDQVFKISK